MSDTTDELKATLVRHFAELSALERSPDDGIDADGKANVSESEATLSQRFYTALHEPVQPKKAKWCKAVSRILNGEAPTLYFAIVYKDHEALLETSVLDFAAKDFATSDAATRGRSWRILRSLARLSFELAEVEPPRVPSRAEIEANIVQHRATRARQAQFKSSAPSTSSMQRAFFDKLIETSHHLPSQTGTSMRERLHAIPKEKHVDLCMEWARHPFSKGAAASHATFGGSGLTEEERTALLALRTSRSKWAQAESTLSQLDDLSRVQQHIPSQMLGTIEGYASELATKLQSGDADLASMDLQRIGQDVLKQCSEQDLNQLASNIDQLLPALGSLQKSVQAQSGGDSVPGLPAELIQHMG